MGEMKVGETQRHTQRMPRDHRPRIAGPMEAKGGRGDSRLEPSEGARPCQCLDLGCLAPRTLRGHISAL